ncbi:unnamed protein product [Ostreobium quekettii]|uniref:Uncharacterized protein n=1 Tax=Ostreobium quekettii TaxID=121088 RepID=A0A8S1IMW6_9CHLO|nr:unnamed protein product [Ostreobium quekettii]
MHQFDLCFNCSCSIIEEAEKMMEADGVLYNKKTLMFLFEQMQKIQEGGRHSIQTSDRRISEALDPLKASLLLGVKLIGHHSQRYMHQVMYPIWEAKRLVKRCCEHF